MMHNLLQHLAPCGQRIQQALLHSNIKIIPLLSSFCCRDSVFFQVQDANTSMTGHQYDLIANTTLLLVNAKLLRLD
jgi:hypothetical protein